jgi:hypothetical protein
VRDFLPTRGILCGVFGYLHEGLESGRRTLGE